MMDANAPMAEVQEYVDMLGIEAKVMAPSNTDITCHQGNGSLIDFIVISNNLAPYVHSFEADAFAPWGTHDGLRLELYTKGKERSW